jgi:hypothetical protein
MRRPQLLASAVIAILLVTTPAQAERRVALVVGNDRYTNLPADRQLQKAVSDARAVGDALAKLEFEVIRGENLTRQALVDKLDELSARLSGGDVAFVFFAGHGVSIAGGNFILPTDVPNVEAGQETRLARAALGESDILADLQQRGVRVAVVVLDACRDNPFRRPGLRSIGGERGLARVEPARGVFTLYSAGIGQTALDRLGDDDPNPNSVFTRVLVPMLAKPGVDLTDLAVNVREEVARLAGTVGHDQRPAYYDETIGGRIYLAGKAPAGAPVSAPPQATAPSTPPVAAPPADKPTAVTKLQDRQTGSAASPGASAALTSGEAQRAVLYEEDPSDSQGKRFPGSVTWRTEMVSPGEGKPPELALRADIEVPERKLVVTWELRRNTDKGLPATHTVEIIFKPSADFPPKSISNVPGILMKQTETAKGAPLAGLAVKVVDGFFMIGLSAVDSEKRRNLQMLRERDWLDIPVVYADKRRAIIAIEKGTAGERAFAEAFKVWQP